MPFIPGTILDLVLEYADPDVCGHLFVFAWRQGGHDAEEVARRLELSPKRHEKESYHRLAAAMYHFDRESLGRYDGKLNILAGMAQYIRALTIVEKNYSPATPVMARKYVKEQARPRLTGIFQRLILSRVHARHTQLHRCPILILAYPRERTRYMTIRGHIFAFFNVSSRPSGRCIIRPNSLSFACDGRTRDQVLRFVIEPRRSQVEISNFSQEGKLPYWLEEVATRTLILYDDVPYEREEVDAYVGGDFVVKKLFDGEIRYDEPPYSFDLDEAGNVFLRRYLHDLPSDCRRFPGPADLALPALQGQPGEQALA
jgi:hypothetical protein